MILFLLYHLSGRYLFYSATWKVIDILKQNSWKVIPKPWIFLENYFQVSVTTLGKDEEQGCYLHVFFSVNTF